jgi:hypothetical protein
MQFAVCLFSEYVKVGRGPCRPSGIMLSIRYGNTKSYGHLPYLCARFHEWYKCGIFQGFPSAQQPESPPLSAFDASLPAKPMLSYNVRLRYAAPNDKDYHYPEENVVFTTTTFTDPTEWYISLLSSSHTLGSDFSHDRSGVPHNINNLHIFTYSTVSEQWLNIFMYQNPHRQFSFSGTTQLGFILQSGRFEPREELLAKKPVYVRVAWAPFNHDPRNVFGRGFLIYIAQYQSGNTPPPRWHCCRRVSYYCKRFPWRSRGMTFHIDIKKKP